MLTKASLTVAAALALTGVTATGALAATRHSGYNAYPNASNAYPNLAEPTRASAHTPPADWSYNYYTPYPYLGP
jgi:hypothetical protein